MLVRAIVRDPSHGPCFSTRFAPQLQSEDARQWWEDKTSEPLYRYGVQGAVFLGVAALVDAAYSGDWSRIGAITTGWAQASCSPW